MRCSLQAYEMMVLGWKFRVLSPVFGCHMGMEIDRHDNWHDQMMKNARFFRGTIAREICSKYNLSKSC